MLVTQPNISLVPLHNTGENIDQKFQCCRSLKPCHKKMRLLLKSVARFTGYNYTVTYAYHMTTYQRDYD